ncbi:hypothetical protein [Nocardia nova]|uniref:hypothetical protein n=1 Tax=Nocardia nova TaxID=37330 RepID=UPI0033C66D48
MVSYLNRDQLARVHGLSPLSAKSYAAKGLLPLHDVEIGSPELIGKVPGLDDESGASDRPRHGWLPVTAVCWERVGRGARLDLRDRPAERVIRSSRGEPGGYSSEQLEAAAKCIEAVNWVVVHLRREPSDRNLDVWIKWNEMFQQASRECRAARAKFAKLFPDQDPPTPEHVLGIR